MRPGESAWMRKDLAVRVFKVKLSQLLDDILNKNVLGKTIAHLHVIEFQKRGLPHAHILIIVAPEDKPRTVDEYDNIICAEIPDPVRQPRLYSIVTKHMIHGPCGLLNPKCVCMENGKCSKRFPKICRSFTTFSDDNYPEYRRRKRFTYTTRTGQILGDEWVVPYCPWASLKYNCHINFEICSTVLSVKYLYKYCLKGHDKLSVTLRSAQGNIGAAANTLGNNVVHIDEITQFVESRYISCCEAMWRLNGFKMHSIDPNIVRLQIHLPDQQIVTYIQGQERTALAAAAFKHTMLTSYFLVVTSENVQPLAIENVTNTDGSILPRATELTYAEFPTYYAWDVKHNTWKRRKRPKKSDAVGRIFSVHPSAGEKFYLRLLLHNVKGAMSFEHLKYVNNIQCRTFNDACKALGLTVDDLEWKLCLQEASSRANAAALRNLFVIILINKNPTEPKSIQYDNRRKRVQLLFI